MRPIEPPQQEPLIKMLAMQKRGQQGEVPGLLNLDETAQYLQGTGGMASEVAPESDAGGAMISTLQGGQGGGPMQLAAFRNKKGRGQPASQGIRQIQGGGGGGSMDCSSGTCVFTPAQTNQSTVQTFDGATPQIPAPTTVETPAPAGTPGQAAAPQKAESTIRQLATDLPPTPEYAKGNKALEHWRDIYNKNAAAAAAGLMPGEQAWQKRQKIDIAQRALREYGNILSSIPSTDEAKAQAALVFRGLQQRIDGNKLALDSAEYGAIDEARSRLRAMHNGGVYEAPDGETIDYGAMTPEQRVNAAVDQRMSILAKAGVLGQMANESIERTRADVTEHQTSIVFADYFTKQHQIDYSGGGGTPGIKSDKNLAFMVTNHYLNMTDPAGNQLQGPALQTKITMQMAPAIENKLLMAWKELPGYASLSDADKKGYAQAAQTAGRNQAYLYYSLAQGLIEEGIVGANAMTDLDFDKAWEFSQEAVANDQMNLGTGTPARQGQGIPQGTTPAEGQQRQPQAPQPARQPAPPKKKTGGGFISDLNKGFAGE